MPLFYYLLFTIHTRLLSKYASGLITTMMQTEGKHLVFLTTFS